MSQLPPIQYGPPPGNPYSSPSPQGGMGGQPANIKNYMVEAILVTIFCNWMFGIVAIIYASQVNSKLARGDYHGALDSSKKAKFWCLVTLIVTIVMTVLAIGFVLLMAIVGAASQQ
ncbi:MAG: CD225/dispanin family protein [Pirellulales bacterium]